MKDLSRMHPASSAPPQRGFTLIELSVALVIGLFLLGGLFTMFQSTRQSYGNQNQLSQLQDNERLAMTIITDVVQSAGYFPDPTAWTAVTALPAIAPFATDGQGIFGKHVAAAPNDVIYVQYMTTPTDLILFCNGQTNTGAVPAAVTNQFSVDAATQELRCTVDAQPPVTLASNVNNLKILYGVKTNFAVDDNNVDTYMRADQMTVTDWTNVSSVKVTISFNNPLFGQAGQLKQTIDFERVIGIMSRAGIKS
jgi:type IV pilus assembly protein PilW